MGDMVDTVARDLLMLKPLLLLNQKPKLKPPQKPGTDMDTLDSHTLMVDTDTHTLMEVTTILARDLPNHLPTMVMDMAVVVDMDHTEDTDMAVMAMAMVVKSYLQEAKGFYYLIFSKFWKKKKICNPKKKKKKKKKK